MFTKLLLVACVCICLVLILYFFYWNRFIAFIIGQIIRVLYWNQEASSIWVEIGSIHFSLPAGRILFKDFRYHSSNQTIKIVKGQLQWRYWIRRPTTEEEIGANKDWNASRRSLSCRIHVSFQGFEWFLYNRTASFDNIVSQMDTLNRSTSQFSEHQRSKSRQDVASSSHAPTTTGKRSLPIPLTVQNAFLWIKRQLPSLDPKDLLPLGIEVTTGAIIAGNPSTPNLLVAEFNNADGTFGVVPSRSKYDLYKQTLNLTFQNAVVRYVDNEDYVESMNSLGAILHDRVKRYNTSRHPRSYTPYKAFSRLWKQVQLFELILDYFSEQRQQRAFQRSLTDASRLRAGKKLKPEDEETPIGIDFSTHEYAVERKILETPSLELTYFVDVVGEVPPHPHADVFSRGDVVDVGNGGTAPEWGVNLVIKGGFFRYGPWADRQRAELQRAFFPPSYQDTQVTPRLKPGDKRLWTALQVFIELRDETTLHIPFREPSKDWLWDGKSNGPGRPKKRESASINVTVGDRSSINYVMPMAVGPQGYEPIIEIHLDTLSVTSSLNDIKLISAESCRIRCEHPSPLKWDQTRTWTYSITLRQPTLYLLRDHINMFTDLGKDWASGPPADYQKFIPMIYAVKLRLDHYEINLYANDHNIIDKPLLRDDNALLILRGHDLQTNITMPSNKFRPPSYNVPFTVDAPDLVIDFSVPRWSTHALHAPPGGYSLLKTDHFHLAGSYRFYAEVHQDNVDQLKLDIKFGNVAFKTLGWAIRYIITMKDNYFGSFTHFSTLYEYLSRRQSKAPLGDPITLKYREGKNNMLQVELSLDADRGVIIGPAGLLGYKTSSFNPVPSAVDDDGGLTGTALMLVFPRLQLYLRLHDYFMEMTLNVDSVAGRIDTSLPERVDYTFVNRKSREVLLIDGIDVVANRLFGPQPSTSTYLCIWEIRLGTIRGSLSAFEAKAIAATGESFGLHFVDAVNAPAEEYLPPVDPDITFYKITVASTEIVWKTPTAALVVSLNEGIKFSSNDLASNQHRKVTSLQIPRINVKVLVTSSSRGTSWMEAGEVVADMCLDVYDTPKDFRAMNKAQTEYVQEQDRPTGRVKRMLAVLKARVDGTSDSPETMGSVSHEGGVFLPQPLLPQMEYHPKPRLFGKHHSRSRQRQPSWRLTQLGNLSDSDEDDGLSEADRDAYVAKSRLSTKPTRLHNDEEAMSSGDESDDADLTDGDSLNSDWSDIADSPNATPESAMLSFYSPLTRHYYLNETGTPGIWDGPAFSIARDKSPMNGQRVPTSSRLHRFKPCPIGLAEESGQEYDKTTIRIRTRRACEMKLTPLILVAAESFEQDVADIPSDPEMLIDSMMASYLPSLLKQKQTARFLLLDIGFPSLGVTILHHISADGNGPLSSDNHDANSSLYPSRLDSTAVLDILVLNTRLSFGKVEESLALRGALGQVTCNVDISLDKRTLFSSAPALTILDTTIVDLRLELSGGNLTCNAQDFVVKIGHRGPAIVVITGLSLFQSVYTLSDGIPKLKEAKEIANRRSISNILLRSQDKAIVDTLSTIQPSYLVQAGAPWRLRSDPGFRLLFHLRSCIEAAETISPKQTGDSEDFLSLLGSRLSTLDQETVDVSELPSLCKVLPGVTMEPSIGLPAATPMSLQSIALESRQLGLTVLDSFGKVATELRMTNVQIAGHKKNLELIQFSSAQPAGMSQASLREKPTRPVRRFAIFVALGEVNLAVFPQLMPFIQEVLRIQKHCRPKSTNQAPVAMSDSLPRKTPKLSNLNIVCSLRRLRMRAAAENLVFEFGLVALKYTSAVLLNRSNISSANHTLLFEEIYLQARSPSSPDKETSHDILAAIVYQWGKFSYMSKASTTLPSTSHRLVFTIDLFRVDVPRSAMRLYRFAEEWRADYLPGIESTVKALLSEINAKPDNVPPPKTARQDIDLHINGSLNRFGVILQVMHGTWLTWDVEKIMGHVKSPVKSTAASSTYAFGVQIGSVTLNISSSKPHESTSSERVRLVLPPLSVAGNYDGSSIHTLALVEFVELKVKPSHWDTLLAVQQKFGQDFNDFLSLMQQTRQQPSLSSPRPKSSRSLQYGAFIKMKGFRIGLEGLSSTLYLECLDIRGGMNNLDGLSWDIGLTGLALSLAPRALGGLTYNNFQRSAFVSIDFKVTCNGNNSVASLIKTLDISFTKIHAVMQASSIGEIGDFLDHLQAEMLERQEQRAIELTAFKEKTQNILKTFDVKVRDVQLDETTSWLGNYAVNVSIQNIGVAFPLTHDNAVEMGHSSRDSEAIKAFLFSIRSISFKMHRGETGEALMKKLCFQFVPRFKQSVPEDFAAESHRARNCLLYPEMKAQLRSSTIGSSRKVWVDANVDGFILDLDSTIPDYVFSLIDVYRKGKERVERLSSTIPRTPSSATPLMREIPESYDKHYTAVPTSNVFASFTFSSGKVRAFSGSAVRQFKSRSLSFSTASQDLTDEQASDMGAEVFNLPTLSVWAEYRATPASQKMNDSTDLEPTAPSLLMFKSTVHSSRNTLRPKLLPFLTEVINRVETRMRKISSLSPNVAETQTPQSLVPSQANALTANPEVASSLQLSFSLRIDQSRLELTCQPDVNVVAAVNWQSGGFTLNVSPGARNVSFTGAVGGLAIGLRHGFLSEDCVNLDARNLTFSVSFNKVETRDGRSLGTVSALLDTELLGGVRFSRLQDILCFKAVWLDRIPVWNNFSPAEMKNPKVALTPSPPELSSGQNLSTVVLVRIRQIKVSMDLGQSISFTVVDLKNAIFRSKLTDPMKELSLFVEDVTIAAKGNLSGSVHVPDCLFQTIRRSEQWVSQDETANRTLELKMTSGPLVAVLESDHKKLLHYRAEPLEVEIFDDWSTTGGNAQEQRPLRLSFVVDCPEIAMVATIATIPKMMTYVNKFKSNLEAQRQGASRESKTYWATRVPRPDNPLSAVAEAMLHSARSRFKEMDYGLAYVIQQHMSLRLNLLRLVVFPRSMNDVEIAQFVGREVSAQFDRLVGSESRPAERDLRLSFSSMTISKHTHNHPAVVPTSPLETFDGREWLEDILKDATEATIVGLPSMNIHMVSEENIEEEARSLLYDFKSRFVRTEGMKAYEDIFITLNMSLYTWLTVLRKTLTREMDQVRAAEDWRSTLNATIGQNVPSAHISGTRKKVPEPLDLSTQGTLEQRSGAMAVPTSASAPSSAKLSATDQGAQNTSAQPLSSATSRDTPLVNFPPYTSKETGSTEMTPLPGPSTTLSTKRSSVVYKPRKRHIERLTMRQLGEATPDVMHPFFMKKAGFNLEDSLPQYVHEYAAIPLEEIMEILLKIYSQQLLTKQVKDSAKASPDI